MIKAQIFVTLRAGVLDPQGSAIGHTLNGLGFAELSSIRQGKYYEVELATDDRKLAQAQLEKYCQTVIANPVIESFRIEIL
ncbi:MAG: phosphoribosylformylglycinamidine synthase subunit PurS [Candidatus Pacebacteria bacterium]|nr:phosphoribosylformylglycinamidine synthase subunit PurS [Candidatus Paceibacterota bacterium]